MTQVVCLSADVVVLIQTADQSLIGVASQWVDERDRTVKKAKNVDANKQITRHTCNDNKI